VSRPGGWRLGIDPSCGLVVEVWGAGWGPEPGSAVPSACRVGQVLGLGGVGTGTEVQNHQGSEARDQASDAGDGGWAAEVEK
jgi:hypothetical protein